MMIPMRLEGSDTWTRRAPFHRTTICWAQRMKRPCRYRAAMQVRWRSSSTCSEYVCSDARHVPWWSKSQWVDIKLKRHPPLPPDVSSGDDDALHVLAGGWLPALPMAPLHVPGPGTDGWRHRAADDGVYSAGRRVRLLYDGANERMARYEDSANVLLAFGFLK